MTLESLDPIFSTTGVERNPHSPSKPPWDWKRCCFCTSLPSELIGDGMKYGSPVECLGRGPDPPKARFGSRNESYETSASDWLESGIGRFFRRFLPHEASSSFATKDCWDTLQYRDGYNHDLPPPEVIGHVSDDFGEAIAAKFSLGAKPRLLVFLPGLLRLHLANPAAAKTAVGSQWPKP